MTGLINFKIDEYMYFVLNLCGNAPILWSPQVGRKQHVLAVLVLLHSPLLLRSFLKIILEGQ